MISRPKAKTFTFSLYLFKKLYAKQSAASKMGSKYIMQKINRTLNVQFWDHKTWE